MPDASAEEKAAQISIRGVIIAAVLTVIGSVGGSVGAAYYGANIAGNKATNTAKAQLAGERDNNTQSFLRSQRETLYGQLLDQEILIETAFNNYDNLLQETVRYPTLEKSSDHLSDVIGVLQIDIDKLEIVSSHPVYVAAKKLEDQERSVAQRMDFVGMGAALPGSKPLSRDIFHSPLEKIGDLREDFAAAAQKEVGSR